MPELGRLTAVFDSDTRRFDAGVRGVQAKVLSTTNVMKSLGSASVALQGPLGGVAGRLQGLSALSSQATSGIGALGVGLGVLTAASVGLGVALFKLVQSSAEAGGELFDLSQKTNFTVETLSGLSIVAKTTGGDIKTLSNSLFIFQGNMVKAKDESSAMGKAFAELKVSTTDQEKALRQAITALHKMGETEEQAAMAKMLFGKAGKDVLGIIKETNGNLDAAMVKYDRMGLIISSSAAKASDQFNDVLEETTLQLSAVTRTIGMEVMPVITGALQDLSRWLSENKGAWSSWGTSIADTLRGVNAIAQSEIGTVIGWIARLSAEITGLPGIVRGIRGIGAASAGRPDYIPGSGILTEKGKRQMDLEKNRRVQGRDKVSRYNVPLGQGDSGGGGGKGGAAKKAKDEMEDYKHILDNVSRSLGFFGKETERARVEQEFLNAGIDKLNPALKAQAEAYQRLALVKADTLDAAKQLADQEEKEKKFQEDLKKVIDEVAEVIFKQGQAISDVENKYPEWLRNTYDFIVAKTKEGFSWSAETEQIYLNNEARREQLRIIAEGATRGRFAALPAGMAASGSESRPRLATYERQAMQDAIDRTREQMMGLGQDITGIFSRSVGDGFEQGAKRGLATLALGLLDIVQNIFLKKLAEGLGNLFSGAASGGGLLSKILGIGLKSFGGGIGGLGGAAGPAGMMPFAQGGYVPGSDRGYDSVPAMLQPGELVLNKRQQAGMGGEVHNHYNIVLPPVARGGYSSPKSKRQMAEHLMSALQGAQS